MSNNPARIQHLSFNDGDLFIRPMCIDAVYKKSFHDNMWDVDFYLVSGKIISITLDDDIVDKVINFALGIPQDSENEI